MAFIEDDFDVTVKPSTGEFEIAAQGAQTATIVWMIHLGLKKNEQYGTEDQTLLMFYELPDDVMMKGESAGKPKMINHFVKIKTGKSSAGAPSTLRGIINAAEKHNLTDEEVAAYKIYDLVGKSVQLNIVHQKSKKRDGMEAKITTNGVSALHKSIVVPAPVTPLKKLYLPKFNQEVFNGLPEWVKKFVNLDEVPVELRAKVDF